MSRPQTPTFETVPVEDKITACCVFCRRDSRPRIRVHGKDHTASICNPCFLSLQQICREHRNRQDDEFARFGRDVLHALNSIAFPSFVGDKGRERVSALAEKAVAGLSLCEQHRLSERQLNRLAAAIRVCSGISPALARRVIDDALAEPGDALDGLSEEAEAAARENPRETTQVAQEAVSPFLIVSLSNGKYALCRRTGDRKYTVMWTSPSHQGLLLYAARNGIPGGVAIPVVTEDKVQLQQIGDA